MKVVALYIYFFFFFFEIVNAEELFCQLRDCDDEFDGYNHYTISFFSTFTSLEFFLFEWKCTCTSGKCV